MNKSIIAIFGAVALFASSVAHAGAILLFEETGAGVTATLSGSLDLSMDTGAPGFIAGSVPFVAPDIARLGIQSPGDLQTRYSITGPLSFGTGGTTVATSTSYTPGASIFLGGDLGSLWIGDGYTSGDALSGTLFFAGATLASLGLLPGSYVYNLTGDTFTVQIGAEVPLPAALPLFLAGLGGLAAFRRRKKVG